MTAPSPITASGSSSESEGLGTTTERVLERAAIASFFVMLGALALFELVSLDVGFHLAAGRYIWTTGSIPTHDVFSFLAEGNPWVDSQWLFQLGLYAVHAAAGVPGLVISRIVVLTATFSLLFFAAHRREHLWVSLLIGVIAVLTMYQRFMVRPELASFFFLALFIYFLESFGRHQRAALIAVPIAQALWANIHGLHILGVALVGAYFVGDALQFLAHRRLSWIPDRMNSFDELKNKALLLGLTIAALFINANGIAGTLYPYQIFLELRSGVPWFPVLVELMPPLQLHGAKFPNPVFVYKVLLGLSLGALLLNFKRVRFAHVIAYTAFLYLSVLALRNMALFAIVAFPITVHNLNGLLNDRRSRILQSKTTDHRTLVATTAAAVLIAGLSCYVTTTDLLWEHVGARRRFGVAESDAYPFRVIEHLKSVEGNIFNSPDIGGYLLWKLYPHKQVALDGRWEVYGPDLERYVRAMTYPHEFRRLASEYDIDTVVLHFESGLTETLMPALQRWHWRITLQTPNVVVLQRRRGAT